MAKERGKSSPVGLEEKQKKEAGNNYSGLVGAPTDYASKREGRQLKSRCYKRGTEKPGRKEGGGRRGKTWMRPTCR